MLALKQTIKDISKAKKITQLEMAEVLGISKQNFSNKVQRNTRNLAKSKNRGRKSPVK